MSKRSTKTKRKMKQKRREKKMAATLQKLRGTRPDMIIIDEASSIDEESYTTLFVDVKGPREP